MLNNHLLWWLMNCQRTVNIPMMECKISRYRASWCPTRAAPLWWEKVSKKIIKWFPRLNSFYNGYNYDDGLQVHKYIFIAWTIYFDIEKVTHIRLCFAPLFTNVFAYFYTLERRKMQKKYDDDDGNHICIDIDKRINVLKKRFEKGLGTQITKKRESCCFLKDWILSSSCFVGKSGFLKKHFFKKKSVSLHRYVVLPIKYVHSIMECYSQADDYLKPQPVSSVEI